MLQLSSTVQENQLVHFKNNFNNSPSTAAKNAKPKRQKLIKQKKNWKPKRRLGFDDSHIDYGDCC